MIYVKGNYITHKFRIHVLLSILDKSDVYKRKVLIKLDFIE